ncbi:extracellular solute-binding protein [Celeribacter marinus]|uniref:ABC transporter, periplasmic substrate-binding protein n=1 Tax=Celeribacter marinus TaxID=1397108 RepID=A0A0N9ZM74_9RHOB|nr:extracellular solute-binding protein [Celeribacter marinus]ALI54364.1 ABC transporter, periplasmic substrate-binding protein [Celeribacter marinus]SFK36619.1 peptide/nickel transport system substrate-binding protein [Celeribacter marinus]
MATNIFYALRATSAALALIAGSSLAYGEPMHGIAMYGTPDLPQDFVSLPYADPTAPKGGKIVTGEGGTFDSLNPFVQKGTSPWQLRYMLAESLMGRAYSEPFTLYCLLCETIDTDEDRTWAEFTLRPEARFSDGSPVTPEDVIWSYEKLGTEGHGRYASLWGQIASIEKTGDASVKFTFNTDNRELALLVGMRPILQKAQWEGKDFTQSGFDEIPIGSAPYTVTDYDAGTFVELTRNPDYWGKDVPFMRGQANLDTIRWEFFADSSLVIEAFKAGELNSHREFNVQTWDDQYDFPAVERGDVIKSIIPHERPSGMTGFVMNTRLPQFSDWRVRQALIEAFNFEYINEVQTGSQQSRITSYYSNSVLGMTSGPAEGRVAQMLAPYADDLPPDTLEGYVFPATSGSLNDRQSTRRALGLFKDAGYTVQDGVMKDARGAPYTFEILLQSGDDENQSIIDTYTQSLIQIGITPTITVVDRPQYRERSDTFDFGMTTFRRGLSLSPGNEQKTYWGSEAAEIEGSRNVMGVQSKAVDGLIETMLSSQSKDDFIAATRALDRVLTAGRYVIPIYQWNISRVAHAKELTYPKTLPIYGDWIGWQPDVWYWNE